MSLILDYANLLAPRIDRAGIAPDELDGELARRFDLAVSVVSTWRDEGRLGFLDLPHDDGLPGRVREVVEPWCREADDVVVLGIGGSALGAVLLRDALGGPRWNERPPEARGGRPRLHVVDNPDPDSVGALLVDLDPSRTVVNVVSKSGSTAETMALYLVVRGWLEGELDTSEVERRLLFTTDPERGSLRPMARDRGIAALDIPPNVGGRFSVLSAVGLVPAAVLGLDLDGLLSGAAKMTGRCRGESLRSDPAGLFATLLHAMDRDRRRPIHVLMPYSDRLRPLAFWFQQLWAESLGKTRPDGPVGPTPLPAIGAVDQHAQVQLFMEGPQDKVIVFVSTPSRSELPIPALESTPDGLDYLAGRGLGELLDAERRATTEALRRAGRPSATIELPALDASALGELILLLEMATVYGGALYGVDPLDQPGVEAGKGLTYGLMGRAGHPRPELPESDPEWREGA